MDSNSVPGFGGSASSIFTSDTPRSGHARPCCCGPATIPFDRPTLRNADPRRGARAQATRRSGALERGDLDTPARLRGRGIRSPTTGARARFPRGMVLAWGRGGDRRCRTASDRAGSRGSVGRRPDPLMARGSTSRARGPTRDGYLTLADVSRALPSGDPWATPAAADLQMHTTDSDGSRELEAMVEAARTRGRTFVGSPITPNRWRSPTGWAKTISSIRGGASAG